MHHVYGVTSKGVTRKAFYVLDIYHELVENEDTKLNHLL